MECLCLDESSCLRLASSLQPLHYLRIFVLPPPRFPCTFPCLLLAVAPVSPHLRLCLPRIFFLLAFPCLHLAASSVSLRLLRIYFLLVFPCLPTRLPLHLLRTFPRCLLIFLASSSFLPSPPRIFPLRFPTPSPCRLYIYPCVLSSSLSLALREQLFATTRGFSPDRDSFCLVSGKGLR